MALDVQDIFDTIMALDNERDLIAGGDEVARGIVILNTVAKAVEAEAATIEGVLTTQDLLYTAENVETTDWPTNLLRLDALWLVDENTNRPAYEITPIQGIGNHVPGLSGWSQLITGFGASISAVGKPQEYSSSGPGGQFYWSPLPNGEYWVRAYGLWARNDDYFADADDTFPYPSIMRLPFAAFCSELFKTGLDRDLVAIQNLSEKHFKKVWKSLKKFNRTEPLSRVYSEIHVT